MDEVVGADGEILAVVETQVDIVMDADGEVVEVTETEVVEIADDVEGKQS